MVMGLRFAHLLPVASRRLWGGTRAPSG